MSMSIKPAISAPTSLKGGNLPASQNARQDFIAAALGMSWQLAIVVLVPLLAGYWLDKRTHTLPLYTFVGFGLALIGFALVVWRQLQRFNPTVTQADIDNAKRLRDQEKSDD